MLIHSLEMEYTCSQNEPFTFKLPIEYCEEDVRGNIDYSVFSDTEYNNVIQSVLKSGVDNGVTDELWIDQMNQSIEDEKSIVSRWGKTYHTDVSNSSIKEYMSDIHCIEDTIDVSLCNKQHSSFKNDWGNFIQKPSGEFTRQNFFIEWDMLKFLNDKPWFQQLSGMQVLGHPLISITIPILMLIIPFIVIKFILCQPITFPLYKQICARTFKNHAFSIFFRNWNEIDISGKIYAVIGIIIFGISLYQSISQSILYASNLLNVSSFLLDTKEFLENRIYQANRIIDVFENRKYSISRNFILSLKEFVFRSNDIIEMIVNSNCEKLQTLSFRSVMCIGSSMSLYYKLYAQDTFHETLHFGIDMNDYFNILRCVKSANANKLVNTTSFSREQKTRMTGMTYPLIDTSGTSVLNDYTENKHVLTGPNGSGKTTYLKTVLINYIFSQQTGYAFLSNGVINPCSKFLSYLNIPDTSSRDSLFQAEARRAIEIMEKCKETQPKRVFVVFDEIYSGTNPEEAAIAGKAYLKNLNKLKNVSYILTTHLHRLSKTKGCIPIKMDCSEEKEGIQFKFVCTSGISKVKGAIDVIRKLGGDI